MAGLKARAVGERIVQPNPRRSFQGVGAAGSELFLRGGFRHSLTSHSLRRAANIGDMALQRSLRVGGELILSLKEPNECAGPVRFLCRTGLSLLLYRAGLRLLP